jgi:hypothetical protein
MREQDKRGRITIGLDLGDRRHRFCVLFVWAALGLFFFWRGARVVFVLLVVLFAAVAPLKPFYIISGWREFFVHLRLLAHGFMICLLYFGSPREYFAPTSA